MKFSHLEYETNSKMYKIFYKGNVKQISELKKNKNKTTEQSLKKTKNLE